MLFCAVLTEMPKSLVHYVIIPNLTCLFKKMAKSLPGFFFAIQKAVTKEEYHGPVVRRRPKLRPRKHDGTKFPCQFYIQIERMIISMVI